MTLRFSVGVDRVEHDPKNSHANYNANPHNEHVQPEDIRTDVCHTG